MGSIKIVEVGPRDGLQNEKICLNLADKLEYIKLLSKTGLQVIEATSFVRADRIPQMADAHALYSEIIKENFTTNISFPCLVPNLKGYELSQSAGVKEISLFSATSDEFTQKNINCTVEESFERMNKVVELAHKDGVKIRGYISTAFGCPYAGKMSSGELVSVIERFLKLGVYEISIGDTIGVAKPEQVDEYLKDVLSVIAVDKIAMHFHDTEKRAISNIRASLNLGVSTFDSSSGGLGGCPYAKGATGNVATEDVLQLMTREGLATGVDLTLLVEASKFILNKVNKVSPSAYVQSLMK